MSKKVGNGHYVRSKRLFNFLIKKKFNVKFYFNKSNFKINNIIKKEKNKIYLVIDFKNYKKLNLKKNTKILKIISLENLKKKSFFKEKRIYPLDIQHKKNSGPKFYFYPKDFAKIDKKNIFKKWKKPKKIKILIIQGGTDANNNLNKIINIILNSNFNYKNKIVVKTNAKHIIKKKYLKNENVKIIGPIKYISKLYKNIHVAISACGGTAFELGFLGIPTIHVTSEPRELNRAAAFNKKKLGVFYKVNKPKDIICELNKICLNKKYRIKLINNRMNYFRKKNHFTKLLI